MLNCQFKLGLDQPRYNFQKVALTQRPHPFQQQPFHDIIRVFDRHLLTVHTYIHVSSCVCVFYLPTTELKTVRRSALHLTSVASLLYIYSNNWWAKCLRVNTRNPLIERFRQPRSYCDRVVVIIDNKAEHCHAAVFTVRNAAINFRSTTVPT